MQHYILPCLFAASLLPLAAIAADPHSHDDEVGEFYRTWMRPKGNFSGIQHRQNSCCNRSDCFPVVEIRRERGALFIRVNAHGNVSPEYKVDEAVIESNQPDPRDSPDGQNHACIIGGLVVCLVLGGGA